MEHLRLLHAADLNLGAAMEGLPGELRPAEQRLCAEAARGAWRRLVSAAIERAVDLVVLAGGTFDAEAPLEARAWLLEGLEELAAEQVPVALVAGDGDRLSSSLWTGLELPAGCRLLTPTDDRLPLYRRGSLIALIAGESRDPASEGRSLPRARRRDPAVAALQIAVRHGAVTAERRVGALRGALRRREVERSGLDAWLLGGGRRSTLSPSRPLIHDPGRAQARWPHETGEHGASLIEWGDGAAAPSCSFVSLAPVVWHREAVTLAAEARLGESIAEVLAALDERLPRAPELVLLRLAVRGALSVSRRRFEGELRRALEERFGARVALAELRVEALPLEARGGEQQSFAEVVLRCAEQGSRRAELLAAARRVVDRIELPLERAAATAAASPWPAELAIDLDAELDDLLSLAAAEALWALNLEDA